MFRQLLLGLVQVHSLHSMVLPKLLYGRLPKKHSSLNSLVVQLRNMSRTMLVLDLSRLRKRLLSLPMLPLDSVHGGDLTERLMYTVRLMRSSRVLTLVINPMSVSILRLQIQVKSGDLTDHHLVMSTPSMARLVVLHSSTVTVQLVRSMFMVIMVTTEILELLVHCSDLVVEQSPDLLHSKQTSR